MPGQPCDEASARPWVVPDGGSGSREDRSQRYRRHYAESSDGIVWQRRYDEAGLERSQQAWDAEMVEFSSLLSNGNGFRLSRYCQAVEEG